MWCAMPAKPKYPTAALFERRTVDCCESIDPATGEYGFVLNFGRPVERVLLSDSAAVSLALDILTASHRNRCRRENLLAE